MDEQRYAGQRLVQLVAPFLERQNRAGLGEALDGGWSPECLALLLQDPDWTVVRAAAVCLSLVGESKAAPALATLLGHDDPVIVEAAEDALWAIWFRAAGPFPQEVLRRISRSIEAGDTENVAPMLTALIQAEKSFAEAYHQRSQAHYLRGAYDEALRDARRAFELNPLHFGALANKAHSYAALGRYAEALKTYREVLALHPHMPGIRTSIRKIREQFTRNEPTDALSLVDTE